MNKYDETHIFRLATLKDVSAIMQFFKTEWSDKHILANDEAFFLYEFQHGKRINFLLAIDKETNKIDVTYGFIQNTEVLDKDTTDIYGVMFKARKDCKVPLIGIETLRRLKNYVPYRTFTSNGANIRTSLPLQKRVLKQFTGRLKQFYMLREKEEYKVAKIIRKVEVTEIDVAQKSIKECYSADELFKTINMEDFKDKVPFMDEWYIEKRYFKHPIYQYHIFLIQDIKVKCAFIGRELEVNGTKLMRIIDVIGDDKELMHIRHALKELMVKKNYEYIDLYEHGIEDEYLLKAGFVERVEDDVNIIPNYFEPFVQQNIEIWYATTNAKNRILKGHGDQDRPNYRS